MSLSYRHRKRKLSSSFAGDSFLDKTSVLYESTAPKIIKFCFGKPDKVRDNYTPYQKLFDLKNVFYVNERYLSSYDRYMEGCQGSVCIVVKSAMGTGKSSRFFDFVANKTRVLIVGSRKTYCDFMSSQKGGYINYQDIKEREIDYIKHPKVVIQVQSLRRIKEITEGTVFAQWNVLYLDEFDSICKELISDVCSDAEKAKTLSYLSKLVATIKYVIVCDANMGQWHYEFLERLMRGVKKDSMSLVINLNKGLFEDGGKRHICAYDICTLSPSSYQQTFVSVLKEHCKLTAWDTTMKPDTLDYLIELEKKLITGDGAVSNTENVYMQILASWYRKIDSSDTDLREFISRDISSRMIYNVIKRNKNIAVLCSSRVHAEFIRRFFVRYVFGEKEGDKKVVLVTGLSDRDHKKIISSVETMDGVLSDCRVFIYTSCFKVGIDVSMKKFDDVFLFLNSINSGSHINIADVYQMIGRIRSYVNLHVYVTKPTSRRKEKDLSDYIFLTNSTRYSIRDDNLEFLIRKIHVEQNLRKHPRLYIACLFRLLSETMNDPTFYFRGVSVSAVDLTTKLVMKSRGGEVMSFFLKIITKYGPFSNRIKAFYENIKVTIIKRLAEYTPLSFETFRHYIKNYSGLSEKIFYKQFVTITKMLSTPTGILKVCALLNTNAIIGWSKFYHIPYPSVTASLSETDLDIKYDLRTHFHHTDNDGSQEKTRWIESILVFLHNAFVNLKDNRLYKREDSLTIDRWMRLQRDIKSVWKRVGSPKDKISASYASPFRLYKTFISEAMPMNLSPYEAYVEVMKVLFSINVIVKRHLIDGTEILNIISEDEDEFEFLDVNKFMVFMVS